MISDKIAAAQKDLKSLEMQEQLDKDTVEKRKKWKITTDYFNDVPRIKNFTGSETSAFIQDNLILGDNGRVRYNKNLKPPAPVSSELARTRLEVARTSQSTPGNDHLALYPQWAVKYSTKTAPDPSFAEKLSIESRNADSEVLQKLSQYFPNEYYLNNDGEWAGREVNKVKRRADKSAVSLWRSSEANRKIHEVGLTTKEVLHEVPFLIREIVEANNNLSQSGFGPISKNSLALYAGRWFDSRTGRIKLLPKAKETLVNPLSRPQKIAYLQARLINHWNEYLNISEQYQRVTGMSDEEYFTKKKNQISRSINSVSNAEKFISKVVRMWKKYLIKSDNVVTKRELIFEAIDLSNIMPSMLPPPVNEGPDSTEVLEQWLSRWDDIVELATKQVIQNATQELKKAQDNGEISVVQLYQDITNIASSGASILFRSAKRLIPMIKRLWKSLNIPNTATAAEVVKIMEIEKDMNKNFAEISKYGSTVPYEGTNRIMQPMAEQLNSLEDVNRIDYAGYNRQDTARREMLNRLDNSIPQDNPYRKIVGLQRLAESQTINQRAKLKNTVYRTKSSFMLAISFRIANYVVKMLQFSADQSFEEFMAAESIWSPGSSKKFISYKTVEKKKKIEPYLDYLRASEYINAAPVALCNRDVLQEIVYATRTTEVYRLMVNYMANPNHILFSRQFMEFTERIAEYQVTDRWDVASANILEMLNDVGVDIKFELAEHQKQYPEYAKGKVVVEKNKDPLPEILNQKSPEIQGQKEEERNMEEEIMREELPSNSEMRELEMQQNQEQQEHSQMMMMQQPQQQFMGFDPRGKQYEDNRTEAAYNMERMVQ